MFRKTGAIALGTAVSAAILLPGAASAASKTVYAGPPPSVTKIAGALIPKANQFVNTYHPDFNGFLMNRVTIHSGDSVKFLILGFHTVDLPGPTGKALPFIVPSGGTATGNDAAGNPFWFDGKLPNLGPNPAVFAKSGPSTYTGSARADSGLPAGSGPPKPYVVKFTKAGTYKYFCDVHPGMIGYVVVKAKGKSIPSAKQDSASLLKQIKADVLTAKGLAKAKVPAKTVSLGVSGPRGVELFNMFPASLSVSTGTVVTFKMSKDTFETHTATFGPKATLTTLAKGFQGGAVFPPAALFASDPAQPVTESATSHGNGFANTGALDQDSATPTVPASGQVKFTQAGTYHFICVIHPQMQGTIVVK